MIIAHITWDYDEPQYRVTVGPFKNNKQVSRWNRLMREANGKGKDRIHPRMRLDTRYIADPEIALGWVISAKAERGEHTDEQLDKEMEYLITEYRR